MKRLICLFLFLLSSMVTVCPPATAQATVPAPNTEGATYIIPIKGIIGKGMLVYVVRRGIDRAVSENAGTIVFDMDTPGGVVDTAEQIIRMLIDLPTNITTCTFINKDALSAGAFIALSTDKIYMAPGSRIGASAIVTAFGDIPDGDMKEKVLSSTMALVKRAARSKGYDVALIDAMMRKDAGYKIGEEVVCPTNRLLTLDDELALRFVGEEGAGRPLLSSGTAKSLDEVLAKIGRAGSRRVYVEITWAENLARWITTFQIVFLLGGLLGLYIEFKTPGFGLPGTLGILCMVFFFWANYVAGLAGAEEMLLFLVGAVLIAIEVFVIPGFGITGVLGLACVALSVLMAMVQHIPGTPWHNVPRDDFQTAFLSLGVSLAGAGILAVLLARFLPETRLFRRFVLSASESSSQGFSGAQNTEGISPGMKGIASTQLHPAGTGMFGDQRLDVVTRGDFLDKGTPIVVAAVEGNRIVVEKT